MKNFTLDGRLLSVGKFVRQGAVFADIGTDHGYLPLFLLSRGVISHAVCSDINEGPLRSAILNAKESGLYDKCTFRLTSGALGLEALGITDYAIAGMGGELIADIIAASPHLSCEGIRLILQPMSRQSVLREYLAKCGFKTVAESYSQSAGKYYVTIAVEYDGVSRTLSEYECEFGKKEFIDTSDAACREFLSTKRRALLRTRDGKRLAKHDTGAEDRLIEYIDSLLN